MERAEIKNVETPDEVREIPNGRLELVNVAGRTIGRAIFNPGWKWSLHVKPAVKTTSCEAPHFQYQISGRMKIVMDDGTEFISKAGDVMNIPSGHDAWVAGDEPVVVVDFQGFVDYAEPRKQLSGRTGPARSRRRSRRRRGA
ncbi:MAG: cupin domain-containing protein [Elusimicrobiota bacterium]|nr:cupin domain-containing protein [Elusimicrobiota bacterium]